MQGNYRYMQLSESDNPYAENLKTVKNYFSSKITLVFLIATVASFVSALVLIVLQNTVSLGEEFMPALREFVNNLYSQGLIDLNIYQMFTTILQGEGAASTSIVQTIISALFSLAIPAIIVISALIIRLKSTEPEPTYTPSAGFTALWVLKIITLVAACISVLGVFSLLVVGVTLLSVNGYNEPWVYGAMVAVVGVVAFMMFSSINGVRFYGGVRKSLTSIYLNRGGAKPYGVCLIISAVFYALYGALSIIIGIAAITFVSDGYTGLALASYQTLKAAAPLIIASGISNFISAFFDFSEGIMALGYSKHIRRAEDDFDNENYEDDNSTPVLPRNFTAPKKGDDEFENFPPLPKITPVYPEAYTNDSAKVEPANLPDSLYAWQKPAIRQNPPTEQISDPNPFASLNIDISNNANSGSDDTLDPLFTHKTVLEDITPQNTPVEEPLPEPTPKPKAVYTPEYVPFADKKCSFCNATLADDAIFCHICGTRC
ncbi:MAG: zinc ribbon domain-containing protein [Oscillospiraceae bacterium]|jgi:hypothetical protein|nr:zinc ribbon domain-containing protein [Oscillospiraceae bacterium]